MHMTSTPETKKILKWTDLGSKNFNNLISNGYKPIGLILHNDSDGKRATVDFNGFVQHWIMDNTGKMIDVSDEDVIIIPELYKVGYLGRILNFITFGLWKKFILR